MAKVYIKRGSLVEAEPWDPTRRDQGVTINLDTGSATMSARGRLVTVRPGDMLVTDQAGSWPCGANSFAGLYQPVEDVLTPSVEAVLTPPVEAVPNGGAA